MRKISWLKPCAASFTLVALCLAAAPSHGAVTADPSRITFTAPDQSFTIELANDGVPIPGKDIRGWQFLASGHDYKHMIDVEQMNGAVKISPSNTVELGSYDLNIDTAQGSVVVRVLTPLSDVPDVVEKMAILSGLSEQKIAEKLGLTSSSERLEVRIDLPPVYYEGQTLELTMPSTPGDGHTCMWFINGESVAEGHDQHALTYTFLEPGDYVLTYIKKSNDNGNSVVATHAKAYTRVVPLPVVTTDVAINTTVTYSTPAGYQKHAWSVDGKPVSEESELERKFLATGIHTIECTASAPVTGPAKGFLRIRYKTTVNPA